MHRNHLVAGFIVALTLLATVAWHGWRHNLRMQETAALVSRTHEVRTGLNRLQALIETAGADSRGFVITGDPGFKESFEGGLKAVADQHQRLEQMMVDVDQRSMLSALEPLIAERIGVSRSNIEVRQHSGFEAARQRVAGGTGEAVMTRLRAQFARMEARELALLEQRSAAARRAADNTTLLMVAGTGLSFALLIIVFTLMLRENSKRRQMQAELDRFFDLSLDLLCIASADGFFKRVSPAFTRTLGWSAEELLACPFLDFVHPGDHAATLGEVERQVVAGEKVLHFENRYRHKDGSWRVLSWKSTPQPDGLMFATARDITEEKQTGEKMAANVRALADFKAALDEHAIVAITDSQGRITYTNDKFCAISKYSRGELLGQDHRLINAGHHPKEFFRGLWETITSGRVWKGEVKNRAKDGTFYWVDTTIVPFLDEPGRPSQFIAIRADITERKEAEEQIVRLNAALQEHAAQLEEANRELESFSYSVSHDLRAPLRHVQGYIQMLTAATEGQLSEKARRFMKIINDASVDMAQLIDDLLSFSRMSRTEMTRGCVALDGLVQETLRGLEMAVQGRNIDWKIAPLPEVTGDASMLRQVLMNLLGNAVKYTRDRDPAQIEVGCAGEEEGWSILFVRDNGAGFDMQYVHKLFGVFQRLHRADEFEGTGIGLATVRRIISRHGGRVWAEGRPGEGATFHFTLKRAIPIQP